MRERIRNERGETILIFSLMILTLTNWEYIALGGGSCHNRFPPPCSYNCFLSYSNSLHVGNLPANMTKAITARNLTELQQFGNNESKQKNKPRLVATRCIRPRTPFHDTNLRDLCLEIRNKQSRKTSINRN